MTIFIDRHPYRYEMERVSQMFFPGDKIQVKEGVPDQQEYIYTGMNQNKIQVAVCISGSLFTREEEISPQDEKNEIERKMAVAVYKLLSPITKIKPKWGILTGIRPVKLLVARRMAGQKPQEIEKHFKETCLVSGEKFALAQRTACLEEKILSRNTPDSFSLYVSIPFCPTRCAYCSFVSHAIEKTQILIPEYVELLCRELEYTGKIARKLGLSLRTIYFGGGTPTALSAEQLKRICGAIRENFSFENLWEYTVEAGRPDTITREKLLAMKEAGVGRISINPQTLNDRVLEIIGRRHTTAQTLDAFYLARQCGFDNINMDLITGLPGDTLESFQNTIDGVLSLLPENITVHTLTVKRSASLSYNQELVERTGEVEKMVDYSQSKIMNSGYEPYYLYRQKGTIGNLENVGYCRPGKEGVYNVYIMDETHSIFAVGAGAVTKLREPAGEDIQRIANYKFPYEYLGQFDEMLARKDKILEFYDRKGKHLASGKE